MHDASATAINLYQILNLHLNKHRIRIKKTQFIGKSIKTNNITRQCHIELWRRVGRGSGGTHRGQEH